MKAAVFTLLAVTLCAAADAQQNRLSLNLSTFYASTSTNNNVSRMSDDTYKITRLMPVLGYQRLLKGNTGVGLELGYSKYVSKTSGSSLSYTLPATREYSETRGSFNEFYISPSLFTLITTKDRMFRFVPELSVPVEVGTNMHATGSSKSINEQTGQTVATGRSSSPNTNSFSVGVMMRGAAQCRIAGGLYAGLQLGGGLRYSTQRIEGESVGISNEGTPAEVRYSEIVDQKLRGFGFVFQPALSISYFF